MRKVVSNHELPHLWAHKAQDEARNSNGSLYFSSVTIYSYGSHFPIAKHVTNSRGEDAILVTTDGYSVTTSGHISRVRQAIPRNARTICVPLKNETNCIPRYILQKLNSEIDSAIDLIATAKNCISRENRIIAASALQAKARELFEFFGAEEFHGDTVREIPATLDEIKAAVAAREQADREREEKRRADALEAARLREIRDAERIQRWLRGEDVGHIYTLETRLRIVGDEVETSRGASFPIAHAKRGLALVRSVMARGEEWIANGHTCHLGHYKIDRITPDGTVHAGCHVVTFAEIERIAPQLETA